MLNEIIGSQIFSFFLVFARIGSAFLLMPGFGESYIPQRVKLALAFMITLVIAASMPAVKAPDTLIDLVKMLFFEITVGVWMGAVARILMTSLQVAGALAGQISALANAFAAGIGSFEGATVMSSFLLIGGLAAIFMSDAHHLIIMALQASYYLIPVGEVNFGDLADQTAKAASAAFLAGFSMAAPFIMLGLITNFSLGLVNKMMPALPVFFVAASLLIGLGIVILALAAPVIINAFLQIFGDWLQTMRFE